MKKFDISLRRQLQTAGKIAGLYLLFGCLWILLSDRALLALARSPERLTELHEYKGWLFIAVTAALLFSVILRLLTSVGKSQQQLRESEDRFRRLTELSPDGVLVEVDGKYVYANQSAARLLGVAEPRQLLGETSWDFVESEFQARVVERHKMATEQKQAAPPLDLGIRRADGTHADIQAVCTDIEWKGHAALQMILRDVSELKRIQQRLRHMGERLQLAVEGSGECIWDMDLASGRVTLFGNLDGILDATGADSTKTLRSWEHLVHPDDADRLRDALRAAIKGESKVYECEYRLRAKDGGWRWVWARGAVVERDETGNAVALTGTLSDITTRKSADEQAWRYANLDPLTALPNRRLFHEKLTDEVSKSKRDHRQLAVLFIDLDGFKQINDLYGHKAGDLLLMEAGYRLKQCVRETDIVARLGGDEFTVTLTQLSDADDANHAEFVCQKILSSLSASFHIGNEVVYISCSIGISLYPLDGLHSDELIRKADQAMYAAKRAGKNQFHYFTKEMDEKAHGRLRVANALRHALVEHQLDLLYQPMVCLKNGRIAKAEALLRWHHPSFGDIEPSEFIPIAEETGLINRIGEWVFMEAARFCRSCREKTGMPFQVSVNKSPLQFRSHDSDTRWLAHLAELGVPPSSISVEITEGVLLDASGRVTDMLEQYRNAGIQIALDDFGTGYSSMAYLQKFQIDYVKIDQSFVRDITDNASSRTIAETIIVMAHKLGKEVIAEGVETQSQLDCLAAAGCDYAQGYLFAHPISADTLMDMLIAKQGVVASWPRQQTTTM